MGDSINDKIVDLEVNAGKSERENKKRFEAINENVARIETNVTDKVINVIDPQIKSLKAELKSDMSTELKSLVEEELNRRFPTNSEDTVAEDKTNKNPKKNIKPQKPKKSDDDEFPPLEVIEDELSSEAENNKTLQPEKEKTKKSKKNKKNKKKK